MKHPAWTRRHVLALSATAAAAVFVTGCAPVVEGTTDGYPDRPIELIVPFSAGGPTDIIGRLVAEGLEKKMGTDGTRADVPVVNKPGAGGIIGTVDVMNANPDGYTLIVVTGTSYGSQPHFESTPYGPSDLTAIAEVTAMPNVLVVNSSSGIETFDDYIAASDEKPGGLRYGTTGVGSSSHANFAALSAEAGITTSDVPYAGNAPMINAVLGNNLDSALIQAVDALPHVESGDFRPLVILGSHQPEGFEDVPLTSELGYTVDNDLFIGIAGPPDMPADLVRLLEDSIEATLSSPETQERFAKIHQVAAFKTSLDFQKDIDNMGTVVDRANEANGGPLK